MTNCKLRCVWALLVILNLTSYSHAYSCDDCKKIAEAFLVGLERTSTKKGFSGGNTHWEQQNLGSYATSEIRFEDIMSSVCNKSDTRCHELLGFIEHLMSDWWNDIFKTDHQKVTNFVEHLCQEEGKFCCPTNHFGPDCARCLPCHITGGACDGNGTRIGSGRCNCVAGYAGESCDSCNRETHFSVIKEESGEICQKCNPSCGGGCRGPGASDCIGCATGWVWSTEHEGESVCKDIDECQNSPCNTEKEYCVNSDGSYECRSCSVSCIGCHGPSNNDCAGCRDGYQMTEGRCEDVNECSQNPNPCDSSGEVCRNTPGSYSCDCEPHLERRDGRCVVKESGKSRKGASTLNKTPQKSKVIWTVTFTREFVNYITSLVAFGLFCWFMRQRFLLTMAAGVTLGAFIYRQSTILDNIFSKQL